MSDRDEKLASQFRLVQRFGIVVAIGFAVMFSLPLIEALLHDKAVHLNVLMPPILIFMCVLGLFSLMESTVQRMERDDQK